MTGAVLKRRADHQLERGGSGGIILRSSLEKSAVVVVVHACQWTALISGCSGSVAGRIVELWGATFGEGDETT